MIYLSFLFISLKYLFITRISQNCHFLPIHNPIRLKSNLRAALTVQSTELRNNKNLNYIKQNALTTIFTWTRENFATEKSRFTNLSAKTNQANQPQQQQQNQSACSMHTRNHYAIDFGPKNANLKRKI
jgi:hypothetical protein